MLVSLRKRFSRGLSYGISYTFSKNFSDYVDNLTGGSTPAYAYNYSLERSFSPFDTTHRFVGNVLYDLPIGKGGMILNNDSMASRMIGGWQINAILTLETGTPFGVAAPDESLTGANTRAAPIASGMPSRVQVPIPRRLRGKRASVFF